MNESFAIQGYSASNQFLCLVDGTEIYQTDYIGNRRLIGRTTEAYNELEQTTLEYYNKLVELGVIVPPKTPEEQNKELQETLSNMAAVMQSLKSEIEELKQNGHKCSCANSSKNVSERESIRSNNTSAADDTGNTKRPDVSTEQGS